MDKVPVPCYFNLHSIRGKKFDMVRRLHALLRWLLFLWVKVEVFPRDSPPFEFDPDKATIYVLADRGLSDLLVLTRVTNDLQLPDPLQRLPILALSNYHSIYSIASRNPLIDWLRRRKKQAPLLQDLILALQQDGEIDLQIVPVSVYWGRPLAKQKHWLQVLFADTWAMAGRTRRFFTLLLHGKKTSLIFSRPIELQAIAKQCDHSAEALHDFLLAQLTRQREATFGPQITSRKVMTNDVLQATGAQQAIEEASNSQKISLKKARSKATRYCREIFADCTQLTIEIMLRLLRYFWRRFYAGIDSYNLDTLKQTALTHQLVYVPCHRSHVDYLLLSYVIYMENLAIPYIAAGNNLDVPFIGRILRGGGAFFIRRSFKDNPLYSSVMRAYVNRLVELGVPLEYFIEGGRSRTGRLLRPKLGMLDMTVQAHIRSQSRPMAFIPVYIGYEKLIEGKSYIGELYGEKKKRESLFGALGAIFKLKGHFGRVTASFGNPIMLSEVLDQSMPGWQKQVEQIEQKPDWYSKAIVTLSERVMIEINRACVVNPINLIATLLLATPRQSIDMQDLIQQSKFIALLIRSIPAFSSLRISEDFDARQIRRIARQGLLHIRQHPLGEIIYLKPKDSAAMSYYRNNSLHTLIMPALIACCFTNARQMTVSRMMKITRFLYPFLKSELHLEWSEDELQDLMTAILSGMVAQKVLIKTKTGYKRPDRSDHNFLLLMRLAMIVQPIFERYYMTFVVTWQSAESPMPENELEQHCYLLAQKISMLYGINAPDFFDRQLFRHFIETALKLGYLEINDADALVFAESFEHVNLDISNLLSVEVRSTILSLI
jgi:glycerol-3-phosphate O-acyltransferase